MAPEVEEYVAAYEALYGRAPKIERRGTGWYRVNNHASFRKTDLARMAGTLRYRAQSNTPKTERE